MQTSKEGAVVRAKRNWFLPVAIQSESSRNLQPRSNMRSPGLMITSRTRARTNICLGQSASVPRGSDASKRNYSVFFFVCPRSTIDFSLRRFASCSICVRTAVLALSRYRRVVFSHCRVFSSYQMQSTRAAELAGWLDSGTDRGKSQSCLDLRRSCAGV